MNAWAKDWKRAVLLLAAIGAVALLHYRTPTTHLWAHPLLQRAYYLPILLAALWFGWRGGLAAAALASVSYIPHIVMAWKTQPEYTAAQYVEIGMFFLIAALTGILADDERAQRRRVEETAHQLAEVNGQLQRSFEQLRRADHLSALGELSAGLAHEIRNPLGSIEGAVQILGRPQLPEDTRTEFTRLASHEVSRLKGLLTNFLEFARPQPPRVIASEIGLLLESVVKVAWETAKIANVDIRVERAESLPLVSVDPEQIKQVLLNLVINAVQATPDGGRITLRANQEGDWIWAEVEDEGVGIPAEDLERIFDPFFTTRSNGTGLGLSIAYQIVSQHGGHIATRRNPQRGMTFSVTLPVFQTAAVHTGGRSA
ncbi:MAG TPA: ATP-binding protein [Acidobacteriaceae bacterium]|nr:ATP-binding protein [Acidobacteriaceae bacterium]